VSIRNLADRVALVTGAGRGIGKTIAMAFAREGACIIAVSRTLSEVEILAAEIAARGQQVLPIEADISNYQAVNMMIKSALGKFGRIDILVNNAGILGPVGPVADNNHDLWLKTININLYGTFLCCQAVLPIMMQRGWGRIINLSGGGAVYGRPLFSAYASSKAAVVRFTECLAEEVKSHNITVNAIAPGTVNTGMQDDVLKAGSKAGEQALVQARRTKEGGGVSANLAAELAVFLASEESGRISGRLISAVWDRWQHLPEEIERMKVGLYTMRRIDGQFFIPVAETNGGC
jgi:3-oxoacyl-[acyl-carrier protein] reductase